MQQPTVAAVILGGGRSPGGGGHAGGTRWLLWREGGRVTWRGDIREIYDEEDDSGAWA